MFTLPLVATTRHLSMQEGAGFEMAERLKISAAVKMKR